MYFCICKKYTLYVNFFSSSKMQPTINVNLVLPYVFTSFVATNISSEKLKLIREMNISNMFGTDHKLLWID